MNERLVEIILPLALRHPLVYRVPASIEAVAEPGCRVRVPLGRKEAVGFILKEAVPNPRLKLRDILDVLEKEPLLQSKTLKLLEWASAYYLTPIGEVLRHLVPSRFFETSKNPLLDSTSKRRLKPPPDLDAFRDDRRPALTHEQKEALKKIVAEIENPGQPLLLHGITGSGKTEVYLEAVRKVLEKEGQALVLVPEIGLTPQIVGRFQAVCPETSVYHSALTATQRLQTWKAARNGTGRVVIATRSGVFLPFQNLKLIVIDEEHDSSYKQEDRFCYHARDLALWRAAQEKIAIVLGSATPSVESLHRLAQCKLGLLRLSERPSGAVLPEIHIIDRRRPQGSPQNSKDDHPIFTQRLLEALERTLKKKEQSLLFLNRRGFAPFVLCPKCGDVPACDQCDISLTLHQKGGSPRLLCHYCDRSHPYDPICPECGQGTMALRGFGTEKVAAEVSRLFPRARVTRMDRDTITGDGWVKILEKMKKREIDILIGTQMITKGHDYPELTLVGILDADLALNLPDFRASERAFQMITQVSGRAGRSHKRGEVLIQTYRPEHEGLRAAALHDGADFLSAELRHRREALYPPFVRLVEIRLAAKKPESVRQKIQALFQRLETNLPKDQKKLLGPSACPIERVRGLVRWRVLIKTPQYTKIQPALSRVLDDFAANDLPSNMKMLVNVDPVDMI